MPCWSWKRERAAVSLAGRANGAPLPWGGRRVQTRWGASGTCSSLTGLVRGGGDGLLGEVQDGGEPEARVHGGGAPAAGEATGVGWWSRSGSSASFGYKEWRLLTRSAPEVSVRGVEAPAADTGNDGVVDVVDDEGAPTGVDTPLDEVEQVALRIL